MILMMFNFSLKDKVVMSKTNQLIIWVWKKLLSNLKQKKLKFKKSKIKNKTNKIIIEEKKTLKKDKNYRQITFTSLKTKEVEEANKRVVKLLSSIDQSKKIKIKKMIKDLNVATEVIEVSREEPAINIVAEVVIEMISKEML